MIRLTTVCKLLLVVGIGLTAGGCPQPGGPPPEEVWIADAGNNRVVLIQFTPPIIPVDPVQCTNLPSCSANYGDPVGNIVRVIGQTATSTNSSGTTQYSLSFPTGIALDPNGNLWVSDQNNDRVLEFEKSKIDGGLQGITASQVIGQPNYTTANAAVNASSFVIPEGIAFDSGGNLYVADTGACRILIFPQASLGANHPNQPSAYAVLAETSFTSACSPTNPIGNPRGLAFDGNKNLWVAASGGVFEFQYNTLLGQANGIGFMNGQQPAKSVPTAIPGPPQNCSGTYLLSPFGVAPVGSNILWVADGDNPNYISPNYNRVVELEQQGGDWNNTPNIIAILGQGSGAPKLPCSSSNSQPNQVNNYAYPSPGSLAGPTYVAFDSSGNLFVADTLNNRVTEYAISYAATTPACAPPNPGTGPYPPPAICTGDNATFIIGEPNGWTSCAGTGKESCFNGASYNPPPTAALPTTVTSPMGIIPITQ